MSEPEPQSGDQARYSLALLGFYGSCAAVAAGAAMFFFASLVLTKEAYGALPTGLKVVGGVLIVIGAPGAFFCLARARRPVAES